MGNLFQNEQPPLDEDLTDVVREKMEEVKQKELNEIMSDPEIFKDQKKIRKVASRKKAIEGAVDLYREYKIANEALEENKIML